MIMLDLQWEYRSGILVEVRSFEMPAVLENPSRVLGSASRAEEAPESSAVDLVEKRLRVLRQPEKTPPVQSLRELWQVMKEVIDETRKARAEERAQATGAQVTKSSSPQP